MHQPFTDQAIPPISDALRYERGNGDIVELKITPTKQPTPPSTKQRTTASLILPVGVPLKINPRANVRVRDNKTPAMTRPAQTLDFNDTKILDHPSVGGRLTAFILFYGGEEYFELHKRCLSSFLATTPSDRIDLRVGSNSLNDKSLALINDFVKSGFITKHYRHVNNDYKYPVMREMFYDPDHPIRTKWLLWFDDDSMCDVEPNWLNMLGTHIVQHHNGVDAHMIGAQYLWTTTPEQRKAIEARPWYRQRPWRAQNGKPSPNGNKIVFATGGFWALTREAMIAADIPDIRGGLTHTGGDWLIGEQLYQAGYGLKQFNGKKQFVRTSSVPRRGATMPTIEKVGPLPDSYPTATQPLPAVTQSTTEPIKLQLPPLVATSSSSPLRDNAMKDMIAAEDAKFLDAVKKALPPAPVRTNVIRL